METLVSSLLIIGVAALAFPVSILLIEVIAATTAPRQRVGSLGATSRDLDQRVAVLVPAHNESAALLPTLADIRGQLRAGDRLVVIVDNSTDDTAAMALAGGAEVVERLDTDRRGKGYALDFGLRYLRANPPEVIIVVDADCRLADNAIDELTKTCAATHRPVQALYLMTAPPGSKINYKVAEFAWRVKNWLRPSGLEALGFPCQLMGTGMAFSWTVICCADLASDSVVEDVKLGMDLTSKGHPPIFCRSTTVTSQFPLSAGGARNQRDRWERGHISIITTMIPGLICKAIANRDPNLLAVALDLSVPPLSLLAILVAGTFVVAASCALLGLSSAAVIPGALVLVALLLVVCLAWLKCGRDIMPASEIVLVLPYILSKLGLYRDQLLKKGRPQWIRTDRGKSE
jgi:glycosyltransferase involved in cell wall biosynthesis